MNRASISLPNRKYFKTTVMDESHDSHPSVGQIGFEISEHDSEHLIIGHGGIETSALADHVKINSSSNATHDPSQ